MASFMGSYGGQTYALMRIVFGFTFFFHGTQKVLGFPTAPPEMPAFMLYGAGGIELVGGALIMIGLMTTWAAFICAGEMAVAYWMAHGNNALLPIQNQGEMAVLYCFAFLFISAHGAGMWSVDAERSSA